MVRLVDATIQQIDTTLCCPFLDISSGGNFCGVQLQLPQADHQQTSRGLSCFSDELVQSVNMANCWPQARSAGHTVEALQPVVAPFARLDRIAATAGTHDAIGPAQLSQVISSFSGHLAGRYQMFHRVAPAGFEQPHYTNTAWVKLP